MSLVAPTSTEERALTLLGAGAQPAQVAAAIGVTESRLSQLLSDPEFASKVTALKFESLQKHNLRDTKIDAIEDKLIDKLEQAIDLCYRPMELAKLFSTVNAAKRRGQSAPESLVNQQTVVQLFMPTQVIEKYSTNSHNQVISTGNQELLTMQSSTLLNLRNKKVESKEVLSVNASSSGSS